MTSPDSYLAAEASATPAAVETVGELAKPSTLFGSWHARIVDIMLVLMLIATAIGSDSLRIATTSPVYPTIMGLPPDAQASEPPSMDELWSMALSTGRGSPFGYPRDTLLRAVPALTSLADMPPWWNVWTHMEGATHPPLYFMTLRLWRGVFGEADQVAIAYSVFWSCVTLTFVYLSSRLAMGRAAAFWTAALFAVAPISSYFAMEIRGYSMLTAGSAIAIWLLVRLTLHGPRLGVVIGLCGTLLACMLTHYFGIAACVAAGLYALIVAGRRWPRVLLCGAITGIIYAVIWLPQAVRQLHLVHEVDYLFNRSFDPWWSAKLAVVLPYRLLAEAWEWPPLGVSACVSVVMLIGVTWAAIRRPPLRPFVVWFLAVDGSQLLMDLWHHTQQLAFIRYSAAAQPGAVAFVQIVVSWLGRSRWAVHAVGIVACVLAVLGQPDAMRHDAPVFAPVALALAPQMAKDDVLIIYEDPKTKSAPFVQEGLLLDFTHVPGCFPRDVVLLQHTMTAQMAAALNGRQAWLLSVNGFHDDPSHLLPGTRLIAQSGALPSIRETSPMLAYRMAFIGPMATAASP